MPCKTFDFGDGRTAIICSCGQRERRCATPGCSGRGAFLCDFPLTGKAKGRTCSRPMCERCRVSQGPGVDYCRGHAETAPSEKRGTP